MVFISSFSYGLCRSHLIKRKHLRYNMKDVYLHKHYYVQIPAVTFAPHSSFSLTSLGIVQCTLPDRMFSGKTLVSARATLYRLRLFLIEWKCLFSFDEPAKIISFAPKKKQLRLIGSNSSLIYINLLIDI